MGNSWERGAWQLPSHAPNSCFPSNRYSHGAHSAHKKIGSAIIFFPLPVLHFCPRDSFVSSGIHSMHVIGNSMHRLPLRGPKLTREVLGSDFPSRSSWAEPAMGSCFCSHMVKMTGKIICQKINSATRSGV